MKKQTAKRTKKEVYVYERGIELFVMLGDLTEDQAATSGLAVNWEKTEHMRKVMKVLVRETKQELAPSGFVDEETLCFVNDLIKRIFAEVSQQIDFNRPFYGNRGQFINMVKLTIDRVSDEKEMMMLAEQHEDMLMGMLEIEENFY